MIGDKNSLSSGKVQPIKTGIFPFPPTTLLFTSSDKLSMSKTDHSHSVVQTFHFVKGSNFKILER